MRSVAVREARTHLSRLSREVEAGEQVEIRRGSLTVAVLGPARRRAQVAELEGYYGHVEIPPDVDEPDAEVPRALGLALVGSDAAFAACDVDVIW